MQIYLTNPHPIFVSVVIHFSLALSLAETHTHCHTHWASNGLTLIYHTPTRTNTHKHTQKTIALSPTLFHTNTFFLLSKQTKPHFLTDASQANILFFSLSLSHHLMPQFQDCEVSSSLMSFTTKLKRFVSQHRQLSPRPSLFRQSSFTMGLIRSFKSVLTKALKKKMSFFNLSLQKRKDL